MQCNFSCRSRPSLPSQENRSDAMLRAGALAKKKRREKQYLLQLTQQQLLQDRLVRDQLVEASARKEREFVRLSGEVVAGEGKALFHCPIRGQVGKVTCSTRSSRERLDSAGGIASEKGFWLTFGLDARG